MDLHAWITQQVDRVESTARLITPGGYAPDEWRIEPSRSGRWTHLVAYSRLNNEAPEAAVREGDRPVALVQAERNEDQFIAMHDPAAVLRRCEADRRILARHRLDPSETWAPCCEGCGRYGDMDMSAVDNLNDCPELLDLAHAHGLTDGILAGLDRPQAPKSKARSTSDEPPLLGSAAATWRDALLGTLHPTPPITTSDVPAALRGPHWKP